MNTTELVIEIRPEKNFLTRTVFEPTTSAIPMQRSTNWANKPTLNKPSKWWIMIVAMKIIHMHCGEKTNIRDPRSYEHYWVTSWNKKWKNSRTVNVNENMISSVRILILWWRRDTLQQEQRRGWACINKDRKAARDLLQMLEDFNNPEAEINKFSTWLQEHVMYIITSVLSTKYISRMSPNKANEVEKIISQKFAIFSLRPRITYKRFTSQIYQGKPENKREVVHMFLVCI